MNLETVLAMPELQGLFRFITEGTLLKILVVVVIVAIVWIVADRILRGILKKTEALGSERSEKIRTSVRTLRMFMRYGLIIITVLVILQICGVNVAAFLTGLGVISIVVGLALQDALKNIIMGVNILIDGFYKVGDYLEYEGQLVRVEEMNLRMTRMKVDPTGDMIVVPNSQIVKSVRVTGRFDIDVPLPYEMTYDGIDEAMTAVLARLRVMPEVEECENKGIMDFGSSAIFVKLRIKARPSRRNQTRRDCMNVIKQVLDEKGIQIPYTQVDVHQKP